MINEQYICNNIDNTCDIVGGESNLIKMGFTNVMGYITMLTNLNKLDSFSIANILYRLYSKDGIYREFSIHVIRDGVLHDGLFTFDKEFNPAPDNLERLFEEKINENKDKSFDKNEHQENIIEDIRLDSEKKFKELFEKNKDKIKDEVNRTLSEDSNRQDFEGYNNFEKTFESNINKFKSNFDKNIVSWLEVNVPSLSDSDYGMLMSLIYKLRQDGKK